MRSRIQNPEFRIQNEKAEAAVTDFCLSFLLDSVFCILYSAFIVACALAGVMAQAQTKPTSSPTPVPQRPSTQTAGQPPRQAVFDLSEAEAIDSTNLGEIARIADRLSERCGKRAAIICTRPEITQVLFSMAFDEVFDICTDANGTTGGESIPVVPASHDVSLKVILSAHRRLMQMCERNREQFAEVVELMEREAEGSGDSEADVRI